MAERICDACGQKKNVSGGKTCEKGHFVCAACIQRRVNMFSNAHKYCPLCDKPLR